MPLLVLTADEIGDILDIDLAIASQRTAFTELGFGHATLPPRLLVEGTEDSVAFCYAARLAPTAGAICKFGSVNPANTAQGLPSISAVIMVLSPTDGRPVAIMDGTSITTIRTSAASAVAASALARPDSSRLCVIGTGVQAAAHVRALARALSLEQVSLCGPDVVARDELARALGQELGLPVESVGDTERAVRAADIVACCTTSTDPVLEDDWVGRGTTVISVGSFASDRREVPSALVRRARVVVDHVPTAAEDAGPIVLGLSEGWLDVDGLTGLGDVLTGAAVGRSDDDEVVYYNSVGIGVQDAAAAAAVLEAANAAGVGRSVLL